MSIGQRIAQKRKELGLSQEALGEELGVSRQAIYKWESDGAVPEVEKLIQLAKRFSVSVGWLLGVEDEPREENGSAESGELTEQQLRMVEEIVSRYLAAQPKSKPVKQKKWVRAVAVFAVIVLVWSMFSRLEQIDDRYYNLQNSVNRITSTVDGQIGSISHRVEEALKQQALFTAEYGAEMLEMDVPGNTVRFSVYAVPKTYVEGMTAEFVLESEGEATTLLVTDAPQQKFSGEMACELTDDMRISVIFVHPDGTRDLQLLESYDGYLSATYPSVWIEDFHFLGAEVPDGKLTLQNFYASIHDYDPGKGGVEVESIRLGIFLNQELLHWGEPCEQPAGWHGFEDHDFYQVPDMIVEMEGEDRLQIAALVKDSLGREFMSCEIPYVVRTETDFDEPYLTYPDSYGGKSRDPADWKFD